MTKKFDDVMDRQLSILPKEVKFCKNCVISNQRPRIQFDENGVCYPCLYAKEKKAKIDWKDREQQLWALCEKYRRNDGWYDVIVPGSGGKDSSSVAHKLKHKYGMHPLTVTWSPLVHTPIGWQNYVNFTRSGFFNLLAMPNGKLHRKLARIGFEAVGDVFMPFIFGQMCYSFRMAMNMNINLVFYGENGEVEYGGSTAAKDLPFMPLDRWAESYWKGVTVDDLIEWGKERDIIKDGDYSEADLAFYRAPSIEDLKKRDIQMHWFSYYEKWVPQENYYYSAEHTGFQANPERNEGTYSKYASIDDRLDGFHYLLMYIKFGIGRCTSDAAHEIRDGHLTREEGVALVRKYDGEFPKKYFQEFLEYLEIDEKKFWEVVEKYRSPHLWEKADGEWRLKHVVS